MRKAKAVSTLPSNNETLSEQIACKAYELYEQRGGVHGHDLEDWFTAERLVREELAAASSPSKTRSKVVSIRKKKVDS